MLHATPGKFCDSFGLSSVAGSCDAGFACTGSSNTSRPVLQAWGGYVCPVATQCAIGSGAPIACAAGKNLTMQVGDS